MELRLKRRGLWALAALAVTTGATTGQAAAWTSTGPTSLDNPLANHPWYVDWSSPEHAQGQFVSYLTRGHPDAVDALVYGRSVLALPERERDVLRRDARVAIGRDPYAWLRRVPAARREDARLLLKIARNPQTFRVGRWRGAAHNPFPKLDRYLDEVDRVSPGAQAFLYVYGFQHHPVLGRCDHWAGGPRFWAAYRPWIRRVAAAIGDRRVAVFLEPDGLGTTPCMAARARAVRYGLFRYAIMTLGRDRNATIYLDAGHSGWLKAGVKARLLRRAGGMNPRVRGFFLNSTGYNRTSAEIRHGNRVARLLHGKHFVVSTAVNGNGPYRVRRRRYANEQRCNPPGRALGPEPSVQTGSAFTDAFLWIGQPGRSGGCRHHGQPKPPPPNHWWEWYALQLAKNAHWE